MLAAGRVVSGRAPAPARRGPGAARSSTASRTLDTLSPRSTSVDYLADDALATTLFLGLRLPQPLLLEGEAGVGKTEAAKALAEALGTPLIRLQCYEGIDAAEALYEWNYPRQLLRDPRSPRPRRARSTRTTLFADDVPAAPAAAARRSSTRARCPPCCSSTSSTAPTTTSRRSCSSCWPSRA